MSATRYTRKRPSWEDLSSSDLVEKLSDFLLHSGFADSWRDTSFTIEELRLAVRRALLTQPILPLEELERLLDEEEEQSGPALDQVVEVLIRRLIDEGLLSLPEAGARPAEGRLPGEARFEIAGRGLDLLGFRMLRRTLPQGARSAFGRHDTDRLATGVEAVEAPKPYEFGDTLNLDAAATLREGLKRHGARLPLELDDRDLLVCQAEHRTGSATVLLLDCSHSMVLYGEDRFTPAKRVALALSHLIRTQYPGDELSLVLFHDGAEEVPLSRLPRVAIGPWHTNTAAGLHLARRILARTRKELKSIVLITDGKPSALTLPGGRLYRNSFGLDPLILQATFEQVAACRRSGIGITTFMLARDRSLIAFVKKLSEIARGKAYFTTPETLGRYVTMDFVTRKVQTVH